MGNRHSPELKTWRRAVSADFLHESAATFPLWKRILARNSDRGSTNRDFRVGAAVEELRWSAVCLNREDCDDTKATATGTPRRHSGP